MLGYTIYRNVWPYPTEGPAQWFPVVAFGWLAAGHRGRDRVARAGPQGGGEHGRRGPAWYDGQVTLIGPLVDHHCHGLVTDDLDRAGFEALMNEADGPSPLGTTLFDSMLGLAIRRWCAPVLDLEPHAPADDYLARRRDLGAAEVNRRLVRAAGIDTFVVDTGLVPERLTSPGELAALCGAGSHEILRLEAVAEAALAAGTRHVDVPDEVVGAAALGRGGRRQEHRGLPGRPVAARRAARPTPSWSPRSPTPTRDGSRTRW